MISQATLWTYALPCLAALVIAGLVLSTTNAEPHGTHRAPRGYVPAADRSTPLPLDPAPAIVMRPMSDEDVEEFKARFLATKDGPVLHVGATLTTNREDYVAAPAPLDPDAPGVWLAKWHADYRDELQRRANEDPTVFERLREPSHAELVEETEVALRTVQQVCEEIAARLTSVAQAAVFDWRITTDTGQLPIIDGPIADRYAAALLES